MVAREVVGDGRLADGGDDDTRVDDVQRLSPAKRTHLRLSVFVDKAELHLSRFA